MPSSSGFHRMSFPRERGATASGGVTFMRAASSSILSITITSHIQRTAYLLSGQPDMADSTQVPVTADVIMV